ncbi:hypothetical protein A1351_22275 [Methylosinus sp. R-45379]|nr:hypothetical protein A1351_22275 [Methylosinus sp. R-45379]
MPQWESLINDLIETQAISKPLFLGMCVLSNTGDEYEVIDGQQRLTTLAILLSALQDTSIVRRFDDGRSELFIIPQEPDGVWLKKLFNREQVGIPSRYSQKLLYDAHMFFEQRGDCVTAEHIKKSQMILYCSEDLQGGTSLFERVNMRGREVANIDLVKNRLFDWSSKITNACIRSALEGEIKDRFQAIFRNLNPFSDEGEVDPDSFLRNHWILFDPEYTKTTDFSNMVQEVDDFLRKRTLDYRNDEIKFFNEISNSVRDYIHSLEEVSILWRKVTAPRHNIIDYQPLQDALVSFNRLRREANFLPILIAALKQWGERPDTVTFVKLVEIVCFREVLVHSQSNKSRTAKWSIAKRIFRKDLKLRDAVHELFWEACPWWDMEEVKRLDPQSAQTTTPEYLASSAFDDPSAYDRFYRVIHYFFWEYGKWLFKAAEWPETRQDVSVQTNDQWDATFRKLEVEHIFPRNPQDADDKLVKDRIKEMRPYLNHWGNLTLLTKRDNASLQNSNFRAKLEAVLEDNSALLFNKLLRNKDYRGNLLRHAWSPNNCRKRTEYMREFANTRWGSAALRQFELEQRVETDAGD